MRERLDKFPLQFVSFPHVISELADHVETRRLKVGRDKLMWVLLQFISGSIAKNPTGDFLPVLRLYWCGHCPTY